MERSVHRLVEGGAEGCIGVERGGEEGRRGRRGGGEEGRRGGGEERRSGGAEEERRGGGGKEGCLEWHILVQLRC